MKRTPCAAALAELVAATDENAGVMHAFSFRQARALRAARAVLAAAKLTDDQGPSVPLAPDASLVGSSSINPPKCDNSLQCSPDARYDEVSHGLTSLTLKCRLCGGIRRSDWD